MRREKRYSAHEDKNRPTLTQVNSLILRMEDYLDRQTGHSWRQRRVTGERPEMDAILPAHKVSWGRIYVPVQLQHRMVRSFVAGTHEILVYDGSTYVDWVANKTEGRNADWFVNQERGVVYLNLPFLPPFRRGEIFEFKYDYGEANVPGWVADACTMLVAARLEQASTRASGDIGDKMSVRDRAEYWQSEAQRLINENREFVSV